jgi:hypothetical protein
MGAKKIKWGKNPARRVGEMKKWGRAGMRGHCSYHSLFDLHLT